MRIPTPTIPISQQSSGQFAAPTAGPMQDASGQQLQQLGQSLQQAGASASRIGMEVQADLDEGFLLESDAIASEEVRKFVGEYQQRAGLDAIESFEDTHKGLKDRLRNLGETARSPQQQQALDRRLAQRFQDASDRMVTHRDRAIKDRAIGGADAGRKESIKDYYDSLGNPEDMALHRTLAMDRMAELSRMRGDDEATARMAMLATTTAMHAGAADSMLKAGRAQEAEAYLKQWKDEIDPLARAEIMATTRAAVIEDMARNAFGAADTFTERKRFIDEAEDMTPKEQESATRHLVQMQDQESRENARIALDVKRQADEWNSANPFLDMRSENPALYSQVAKYGVTSERERVNVQQFIDESRTAEGMRRLRALSPEQLDETLARFTTSSTGEQIKAMVLGDQSTVTILQNTKELAGSIGVDVKDEDAFNRWRRNTIDPLVDAESTKLGRKLTPTEFQKLVVNPLMGDKVLVDGFFGYTEMPVIQAQQEGYLPIDNPATEVDESLDVKNATVAVRVDGQVVRLAQIPMDQRRKIREAYRQEWVAQRGSAATMPQMTAAEEAARWVRGGRVGDKAKRAAEDMRVPGVGWGVGDLNRADLPPLPDRSGEPDEYLIPGVQQAELPK